MSKSKKSEEVATTKTSSETEIVSETVIENGVEEVKKVKKQETVTYLGPTIPNVVENGAVFLNGNLTNIMENKAEEIPLLKSLLVKTSDLVKAKKELRSKESALSAIYRKAEQEVAKNE